MAGTAASRTRSALIKCRLARWCVLCKVGLSNSKGNESWPFCTPERIELVGRVRNRGKAIPSVRSWYLYRNLQRVTCSFIKFNNGILHDNILKTKKNEEIFNEEISPIRDVNATREFCHCKNKKIFWKVSREFINFYRAGII